MLALLSFTTHLAFQGTRGIDNSSEGRYAECAREMLASGDYMAPQLNGYPHWTKPPLGYWVPALGMKLLGENGWGARGGNAVLGATTVLLVGATGAALFGPAVGLTAGFIYLSAPFPFFGAHALTVDTMLTFFVAAAFCCYAFARRSGSPVWWVLAFWLAAGLGFMTKGPLVLLPIAPLAIWHHRSGKPFRLFHPAGLAVFLVSGFWWYVVTVIQHPELVRYYLFNEIGGRFTGAIGDETTHNRQFYKPVTVYLPVLTVGAGAWFYYGFGILRERGLYRWRSLWAAMQSRGLDGLLILWLVLPLIVFCIASSRLHLYVLPLFPAITLACAHEVVRRNGGTFPVKRVLAISLVSLAVMVSAKAAFANATRTQNMKPVYERVAQMPDFDKTTVVTFENSEVYALQFYLKGKLRCSTAEAEREIWEESVEDIVAEIKATFGEKQWVFLCTPKRGPLLQGGLEEQGFTIERIELKKWWLLRVTGVPR